MIVVFALMLIFGGAVGTAIYHDTAHAANGESSGIGSAVSQGYKFDRQASAFRTSVSSADTLTVAGALATTRFTTGGRQNLPVSARFSNAGATCKVRFLGFWSPDAGVTNYFLGMSEEITLTASAITDAGGKYVAPNFVFDGLGASDGRLLVTSVSAGSVDFWFGSY